MLLSKAEEQCKTLKTDHRQIWDTTSVTMHINHMLFAKSFVMYLKYFAPLLSPKRIRKIPFWNLNWSPIRIKYSRETRNRLDFNNHTSFKGAWWCEKKVQVKSCFSSSKLEFKHMLCANSFISMWKSDRQRGRQTHWWIQFQLVLFHTVASYGPRLLFLFGTQRT